MPRLPLSSSTALLPLVALLSSGCDGQIGEPSTYLPGGNANIPDAGPSPGVDLGTSGGPSFDPFGGGGATLGVQCGRDEAQGRLVLTVERGGCQDHAALLTGGVPDGDHVLADIPLIDGPGRYEGTAEICLSGQCETRPIVVEVDVDDEDDAIGRWTIPLDGRTATGPLAARRCDYDDFLPGRSPHLAPNLSIREVALYQGVKVPLVVGGEEAPRETPVVAGRPGLLRVFVEPQPGFLQTRIEARLELDLDGTGSPSVRTSTLEIAIASREANRGTTFEFPLAAADVSAGARWSVSLRGAEPGTACAGLGGDTSGARFPSSGTLAFDPEPVGRLEVVLVPFRYNADGSGRLPDTSEQQVERYRDTLMGMFPVEGVDISVREPVDLELTVTPASGSWGPVLQRLLSVRADDAPAPHVYYYGLIRPSEGGWSGTAGLGPLASAPDVSRRGAIGLGGTGFGAARTGAHELGHAAGRAHAPCGGAGNPDPNYPYPDGGIGVWGYDFLSDSLKDPVTHHDLMGYCSNDWISDYNYRALVERYAFVNQTAPDFIGGPTAWRAVYLEPGRPAIWDRVVLHEIPPFGDDMAPITYLGPKGEVVGYDEAVLVPLDHADGVIAWVPAAPAGTVAVELGEETLPY